MKKKEDYFFALTTGVLEKQFVCVLESLDAGGSNVLLYYGGTAQHSTAEHR